MVKPLIEFLRDIPDPRCNRKKRHELAEVLMLIIIGFLAGKHTFRRMQRWLKKNEKVLKKYLKLSGGIPSIATMSRIAGAIDSDLAALAFADWIGQIVSTRGIHIVIDGKGLRAATERIRGGRTPYILNAIDAATKLVIAQLAIPEKTNEMTAIPELIRMLNISNSTVTIDAIGATSEILNLIDRQSGYFVQQVKKNCPATYQEIKDFSFEPLAHDGIKGLAVAERTQGLLFSRGCFNTSLHETTLFLCCCKLTAESSNGKM